MQKLLSVVAAVALASIASAHAQTDFPSKPVVIIVPFAAGGPSDVVTRILADELAKIWKQQVVIDNKAGGGTSIGNALAARARPDGYTLLMVAGAFVTLPGVRESLPYDTLKDFKAAGMFVSAPMAIVAHPAFKPNSLAELIDEAKKQSVERPLTFASSGVASSSHMAGELIQRKAGIKLKHISYSGEAANISDVLSGRVDFQIGTWSTTRPYVESGKLKLISMIFQKRVPEAPNTATLNETITGIGTAVDAFNAIVVPAGVPGDIAAKISEAMKAATSTPIFKEKILAIGSYPNYMTPEDTDAFLRNAVSTWGEIAKAAGIKVE